MKWLIMGSSSVIKGARLRARTSTRASKVQGALFIAHFLSRTSTALFYITFLYAITKVLFECRNQQFQTMKQANKLNWESSIDRLNSSVSCLGFTSSNVPHCFLKCLVMCNLNARNRPLSIREHNSYSIVYN